MICVNNQIFSLVYKHFSFDFSLFKSPILLLNHLVLRSAGVRFQREFSNQGCPAATDTVLPAEL